MHGYACVSADSTAEQLGPSSSQDHNQWPWLLVVCVSLLAECLVVCVVTACGMLDSAWGYWQPARVLGWLSTLPRGPLWEKSGG
eukprot:scaffold115829_cov37-Tisochrysis_lutea.AAC.2